MVYVLCGAQIADRFLKARNETSVNAGTYKELYSLSIEALNKLTAAIPSCALKVALALELRSGIERRFDDTENAPSASPAELARAQRERPQSQHIMEDAALLHRALQLIEATRKSL
jgi:hypothetical protein